VGNFAKVYDATNGFTAFSSSVQYLGTTTTTFCRSSRSFITLLLSSVRIPKIHHGEMTVEIFMKMIASSMSTDKTFFHDSPETRKLFHRRFKFRDTEPSSVPGY
jgi:hypothetical protein